MKEFDSMSTSLIPCVLSFIQNYLNSVINRNIAPSMNTINTNRVLLVLKELLSSRVSTVINDAILENLATS